MSEEKGLGSKLLGLFVETGEQKPDAEGAEKSPAEIVAELAATAQKQRPAPPAASPNAAAAPARALNLSPASEVPTDFEAIFRGAGMDPQDLDRVKKAEELLKSLPDGTPQAVKKQIVEASLRAFGFEVEKIVSAAQNQQRALDAYLKVNETSTAQGISQAEQQIRELTDKIANLRGEIEQKTIRLAQLNKKIQVRKGEVGSVLDFFVAPPPAAR